MVLDPLPSIRTNHNNADFFLWRHERNAIYALYPLQEDILEEFRKRGIHLGSPIIFTESGILDIGGRRFNVFRIEEAAALLRGFSKTVAYTWAAEILSKVSGLKFPHKSYYLNANFLGKEGYFLDKAHVMQKVRPAMRTVHDIRNPPWWQFWRAA